jgi:hypothetical protein
MEFLLGIIIGLAVGLALRKNNSEGPTEAALRRRIGEQLETSAQNEDPDVAKGLRRAALQVINPTLYSEDTKPAQAAGATAPSAHTEASIPKATQNLDSVSVLLYFGAFLVISGVGLFVGLSDVSGGVKTFAVLAMALVFYGAGLAMYGTITRLRPAAIALTAIGLVCLPLTGAAANIYLSNDVSGSFIWFVTSLTSFVLYIFALLRIRQSLMGYLSVFMCVSLWLSIVSVVEAPIYFFGWASILLAMIYVAIVKFWKPWPEVETPLSVSASVMVPTALLATIFLGHGEVSLTHQGVTALLASTFYALALWREAKPDLQQSYFALGYLLAPLGVLLVASDVLDGVWVSYVLSAVAVVQLLATLKLQRMHESWRQSALVVTSIALAVSTAYSVPLFSGEWAAYVWVLVLNTVLSLGLAFWQRDRLHMALGLTGALLLPSVLGFLVADPDWPKLIVVLVYAGLAVGFLAAGRWVERFKFKDLSLMACVVALIATWSIGISGPLWLATTASLIVGAITLLVAYYEKLPKALYAATLLGVIATGQWLVWQGFEWDSMATVLFGLVGLAYYAVGRLGVSVKTPSAYNDAWIVSGLATLYLAALIPLFGGEVMWATVGCLAIAGALTSFESRLRAERMGLYGGAAVVLFAIQLGLYKLGVEDSQVFTHLWAGYFAVLAWLSHRAGRAEEQKNLVIVALSVLTVPLAFQALGDDSGYGLLLLFESVAILLFGLWTRYPLISWWGLSVAVGSVLYQLREFQFFVLALLGAGIIGLGVVLLLRQEKNKDK